MYTTEDRIIIKARGNQTLPIDKLLEFQGGLKRLTPKNRDKLMASILEYCDVIRRRWTKWAEENGIDPGLDGLTDEPQGFTNE